MDIKLSMDSVPTEVPPSTCGMVGRVTIAVCSIFFLCCRGKQSDEQRTIRADDMYSVGHSPQKPRLTPTMPDCPVGMVGIPGGEYVLGESTKKAVVNPFCMDVTEVTVAAYKVCTSCSKPDEGGYCNWGKDDRSEHPINCIDFAQAKAYCASLGKRLPSEEEWEWAARGGDEDREYPWGKDPWGNDPWGKDEPSSQLCWDGEGNVKRQVKRESTCQVKSYPKGNNRWGIADMSGNVWEWTATDYSKDGTGVVLRGGCWGYNSASLVRASIRFDLAPDRRNSNVGVRCVR